MMLLHPSPRLFHFEYFSTGICQNLAQCAVAAILMVSLVGCQSQGGHTSRPFIGSTSQIRDGSAPPASSSTSLMQTQGSNSPLLYSATGKNTWTDVIDSMFLHARSLVEADMNVDLKHIQLRLVNDEPINEEVARETRRLVDAQFGPSHFADQFLSKIMKAQAGTYAALFTARLNSVMVSRNMLKSYEQSLPSDPHVRSAALLTLLIHELVHAADDLRYRIHEQRALNFRASFAQSATFEGHAQWVTRRICAANGCTIGLNALDDFMFSREPQLGGSHSQPVEAISRNVLEYSYVEGERFIAHLAKRPNGDELIDALLSAPPYDPIQILAPDSYPDVERETRNQRLIQASMNIDHPWTSRSWVGVETSPLKGVNLRSDPSRRQAAVDGFTRLIHSMVAIQLYDRAEPSRDPMEVTVLQAESANTATLFARTLHENTQHQGGATANDETLRVRTGSGVEQSDMMTHIYRTVLRNDELYRTAVVVAGPYVIQVAGVSEDSVTLDDYALRVLLNLQLDL